MIELALEFFFGLFSLSAGPQGKKAVKPVNVLLLVLWLGFVLSATLIFG